ncbi:mannosyltransferase [Rhodococcus artemisiae]|uniref:Mannosyltransferase n=1 Tax=Rhodococcus artemisiae TaxID=714159 RepID=A0ABU7LJL9_9NOCA|nr:mannosyltransferase [Rhodococcus artemisiae]MEE2061107.1 mannosyltransferase [Rhodococcus artemisiae]
MPERARSYRLWCVLLLLLSVVARLAWGLLTPNGMNLVDLHVYVDGSAALLSGELYDFTYSRDTPDFPLPFTYPPFAALVFLPLHHLPFGLLGVLWLLLTIAALFWVIRIALELLVGPAARGSHWTSVAMVWTAVAVWSEPVRTTLDYGQINVFLVLAVMVAVRSSRWWLSGGIVGVVAGIKLTPAITGVYFLARRRWRAAFFSAVAFGATVVVSSVLLGEQARTYFTSLFGDADRIGPVGSVWNQSLRGALSRLVGRDVDTGAVWIVAVAACAVLAFAAWRSLGPDDRLGTLVIVQLFGLLVSPISWVHHWVWVVPMLLWLVYGPLAGRLGTWIVAACWTVVTLVGVPWVLSTFQASMWDIDRPAPLAWLGAVNVVGVLVVYLWMIIAPRVGTGESATAPPANRSCGPDPDRLR